MAQKFYKIAEVAEKLGKSEDEIKKMVQRNELHGYRDGAAWKFKVEQIDEIVANPTPEEDGDVLLSEVELGRSDPGTSGTVIGPSSGKGAADSDIHLATDSDLNLAAAPSGDDESGGSQFEDLDLTLDDDLSLEDSGLSLDEGLDLDAAAAKGDSGVDLDDDDLVLGGSGTGSDITIGGDSGISLVDPSDSGLSLEDPIEFTAGGDESLELGEDDMIELDNPSDLDSPTELKADEDFLLTPLDESGDEDSESGSQVIALDAAAGGEDATMIAVGDAPMAAMLDEDLGDAGLDPMALTPMDSAAPMGAAAMRTDGTLGEAAAVLPETPYGLGWVLFVGLLLIPVLFITGIMMFDLLRNMWSWNGPSDFSSPIMDKIIELIEGK